MVFLKSARNRGHAQGKDVYKRQVRNWLAKVAIPKDKEALIRLMMEKTEREKTLKEAARANWKPFGVMLSSEDYKLSEEAARRDNMTAVSYTRLDVYKRQGPDGHSGFPYR